MALRYIVCLMCIVGAARCMEFPPELKEVMEHIEGECNAEFKPDNGQVEKMRKEGNFDGVEQPVKCYIHCIMTKFQILDEDSELQIDFIEATIPEELKEQGALETLRKCEKVKGDDNCGTAFEMIKCFHHDNPALSEMFE